MIVEVNSQSPWPKGGCKSYQMLPDWIDEVAGKDMVVSLVMPTMANHRELEQSRGDSFRINENADKALGQAQR